ncbi:MAG: TIGR03985 family CRISPR-associated protein [Cyanobacteria bacterium P01_D01_bin.115]
MDEQLWQEPPSVPLLQWLARGPLKQNLLQGIRLWVWLHLLYGEAGQSLALSEPFTYAHWRDRFFSPTHPTGEKKPHHADPHCPCNKSAAAWLFAPSLSLSQAAWETHAATAADSLRHRVAMFAQALKAHDQLPDNFEQLLSTPLFGMTRRTLYGDLRILASISWLQQTGQTFQRVQPWPDVPQPEAATSHPGGNAAAFLTQPDLAAIAENLSKEIGGDRRFFVHVEYVVPPQKLDRVDDWQVFLSELWQRQPVPPVRLQYLGAGDHDPTTVIVYPICLYYFRRGPYLCAFGQVPRSSQAEADWRNYRLDRILNIEPLTWAEADIPLDLRQRHATHTLPQPDDIALRMEEAWGFDYYQPAQVLLLRFDQTWNDRYIRDTIRHATFKQVSLTNARRLIQQTLPGAKQQQLLTILQTRSPEDAYYTAIYREHDPNVHQRLRAWRPRVEVLLPFALRQRFAQEVRQEARLYIDDNP